jgi:hypothetical protein
VPNAGQRRDFYQLHVENSMRRMFVGEWVGNFKLTEAQQAGLDHLRATYALRWLTLFDSLAEGTDTAAGDRRVLEAVAWYLGEYRALLTTEQRVVFDYAARQWSQSRATRGRSVVIPGVE